MPAAGPPLVAAAKVRDSVRLAALLAAGANPCGHDQAWNTDLIIAARDDRVGMM